MSSPASVTPVRTVRTRPGWPELGAAAVTFGVLFGAVIAFGRFGPELPAAASGLVGYALSALLGLLPFAVAMAVRMRRAAPFGLRRVPVRWLAIGAAGGVGTFVVGLVVSLGYVVLTGDTQVVQGGYQAAASAGVLSLIATLLLGSVATPIGEEFLWRGVVANTLGRFPAVVSVLVSAALFALAHGINPVLPTAFVVGIATALFFRRTGSVWPGVCVHLVHNTLSTFFPLVVAMLVS